MILRFIVFKEDKLLNLKKIQAIVQMPIYTHESTIDSSVQQNGLIL
jgi:hypothetical protein